MFINNFAKILPQKTITLNKGDILFFQDEKVENIYFLKRGRIKLIRETICGNPLILHQAYAGESFAEASLFADIYHCHAVSGCTSELIFFNKNDTLNFLEKNPTQMMDLLKTLTNQVRDLRFLNELKSTKSAKERVLNYLKHLTNDNMEVHFNASLKDTAQKIGLAH